MRTHRTHALIILILILAVLSSSCRSSGYWIPPSSSPTPVPFVEVLSDTHQETPNPENATVELGIGGFSPPKGNAGISPTDYDLTPAQSGQPQVRSESEKPPAVANALPSSDVETVESAPILYYAQAADTLPVIAVRFGVQPAEITSPEPIPETGFINPGQLLIIPRRLLETTSSELLLPDSEVVYSPSAVSFDVEAFVQDAGGYLSTRQEYIKSTGTISGAQAVRHVALENSINPRLLLALLEYHGQWVYGQPVDQDMELYPLGVKIPTERYLYNQLVWAINQLSTGYYAYREGRLTEISFGDGSTIRLAPDLNAGTAALQYYFAQLYQGQAWRDALYADDGFLALHKRMFGDPWQRAATVEPLYPPGTKQPELILPFERNWTWSYTGGPHGAWEHEGAYAALDFGPGIHTSGCVESSAWTLAASDGLVVRTGEGLVVLDLDGDGHEQTGWVLVYLHVSSDDRIPLGSWVAKGDPLGHPSCEGGFATGTHLHIARKFNGEWVPADGPLPFNLGGWIAHAGDEAYQGTLTRDVETVVACTCSNAQSFVTRGDDDP